MTSIQEVADQINAKLDAIGTNTAQSVTLQTQIKGELQTVSGKVSTMDGHLQNGLADLTAGLVAVWEINKAQLSELRHHSEQQDTMICLLGNATELLCGITRKLTQQLALTASLDTSVNRLEGIAERTEASAAGDYDRLQQVTERIEECCPDEEPRPEPCPEACAAPKQHRPYQPKGQDWKPRQPDPRPDDKPDPIG